MGLLIWYAENAYLVSAVGRVIMLGFCLLYAAAGPFYPRTLGTLGVGFWLALLLENL